MRVKNQQLRNYLGLYKFWFYILLFLFFPRGTQTSECCKYGLWMWWVCEYGLFLEARNLVLFSFVAPSLVMVTSQAMERKHKCLNSVSSILHSPSCIFDLVCSLLCFLFVTDCCALFHNSFQWTLGRDYLQGALHFCPVRNHRIHDLTPVMLGGRSVFKRLLVTP